MAETAVTVAPGIESRPDGLAIAESVSFNEWRRIGEQLFVTRERLSWSIGDWWAFGERFGMDYAAALEHVGRAYTPDTLREYARVARGFPVRTDGAVTWRRTEELSFAHHHHVLSIPDPEKRMQWLDEAVRQGWSVAELREEARIRGAVAVRIEAFNVKVVDAHYRLALTAAERRGMDPRAWVLEAIRELAARELPEVSSGPI